jgi:hypothetical protein
LASLVELETRCRKQEEELKNWAERESSLRDELTRMGTSVSEKNSTIDNLKREFESSKFKTDEKLVDLHMIQKANAKGKDEAKERDKEIFVLKRQLEKMTGQMSALQVMNEEKAMSVSTTKELVQALQARLMEVEPELAQARDKIKDLDRHVGASVMMKVGSIHLFSEPIVVYGYPSLIFLFLSFPLLYHLTSFHLISSPILFYSLSYHRQSRTRSLPPYGKTCGARWTTEKSTPAESRSWRRPSRAPTRSWRRWLRCAPRWRSRAPAWTRRRGW